MTVNEFAQDVHKNAVAHGWYDAPITFPEVAVMIHAEISEAVVCVVAGELQVFKNLR